MKAIGKENDIVKDKCPSCGKDGAIIQTTEYTDSKYIEVMCLNGCGHFATIIKRESGPIDEQMTNEEWLNTLSTTEKKAEALARGSGGLIMPYDADKFTVAEVKRRWERWLKQPHTKE